jgi:hypothetical protein
MKRKFDRNLGAAMATPSVPIPPPGLLERAKKLGAVSAGPANISLEFRAAPVAMAMAMAMADKPARRSSKRKRARG